MSERFEGFITGVLVCIVFAAISFTLSWKIEEGTPAANQVTFVDTDDGFSCTRHAAGVYILKIGDAVDAPGGRF